MASAKKKQEEKSLKLLRELASLPANKLCFDCEQKGPTYVNMTIGSFVCTSCSGILRGLTPPHRVKSITMATFSTDEIDQLRHRGNQYCEAVWLGLLKHGSVKTLGSWPPDETRLRDLLIDKYEKKRYYIDPLTVAKSMSQEQQAAGSSPPQSSSTATTTTTTTTVPPPSARGATERRRSPLLSTAASTTQPVPSFANFDTANIFTNTNTPPIGGKPIQSSTATPGSGTGGGGTTSSAILQPQNTANGATARANASLASVDRYAALKSLDEELKTQVLTPGGGGVATGQVRGAPGVEGRVAGISISGTAATAATSVASTPPNYFGAAPPFGAPSGGATAFGAPNGGATLFGPSTNTAPGANVFAAAPFDTQFAAPNGPFSNAFGGTQSGAAPSAFGTPNGAAANNFGAFSNNFGGTTSGAGASAFGTPSGAGVNTFGTPNVGGVFGASACGGSAPPVYGAGAAPSPKWGTTTAAGTGPGPFGASPSADVGLKSVVFGSSPGGAALCSNPFAGGVTLAASPGNVSYNPFTAAAVDPYNNNNSNKSSNNNTATDNSNNNWANFSSLAPTSSSGSSNTIIKPAFINNNNNNSNNNSTGSNSNNNNWANFNTTATTAVATTTTTLNYNDNFSNKNVNSYSSNKNNNNNNNNWADFGAADAGDPWGSTTTTTTTAAAGLFDAGNASVVPSIPGPPPAGATTNSSLNPFL